MSVPSLARSMRAALVALAFAGSGAGAATITLVPGAGFNDSTPATPEGGNSGTTLGAQRTILFNHAASIWGGKLTSSQTIKIQATFEALFCDASSGVLGSAGPTNFFALESGAETRFYPVALAEALTGEDLNADDVPNNEIRTRFNSTIDLNQPSCLGNTRWYYGLTGPAPNGTLALLPTLLHELGHGLGFLTLLCTTAGGCTSPSTPRGGYFFGIPDVWADFLRDNNGSNTYWVDMTDAQRVASFTSDPLLVWDGPALNARIVALGLSGTQLNESRLRMYAPPTFEPGSSLSHFHTAATPNLLMEPSLSADLFAQTDLTDCVFEDIGWVQTGCSSNTAPVLNAARSPTLASVTEDAGAPSGAVGTLVSALVDFASPAGQVDNVTDPDAGALLGIAVTASDSTGSWFFSTNNGTIWIALGAVSGTSARLLAADANTRLYFQPNPNLSGTITSAITFRAWDRTSGTAGALVNPAPTGGSSAFSSATDTASIVVNGVNDAPVLEALASPVLNPVAEDAPAATGAAGTLVSALVDFNVPAGQLDNVTDPDAGALLGIAVTAVDSSSGLWTFSTNNGASWAALTAASATSSRLLLADAGTRIHFQPNANFAGSGPSITFRAWDATTGSNGGTANSSINGLATAFSVAFDTASITVTPVNDAPVLNPAVTVVLANTIEDAGAPSGAVGTPISTLVDFASPAGQNDNVGDVDAGALLGIALVGVDATNGSWFFSTNGGGAWIAVGAVGPASARLLAADAGTRLYFQPDANFNGSVPTAITFRAWDTTSGSNGSLLDPTPTGGTSAYSSATDTASLSVAPVNDAPVLNATPSPALATITEDAPAPSGAVGTPISTLVDLTPPAGGLDNVTDVDVGAQTGIAITEASTANGTWFFSTNSGGTWSALGSVLETNARLLSSDASNRIYFRPNANFAGPISNALTFRAWDRTSGAAGGNANTVPPGGTSAFSSATDTASISVDDINDPPMLTAPPVSSGDEDTVQTINLAVADPDAATLTIELGASLGLVSLGSVGGLSFDIGDGASDPQMRFTGSIAAIGAAISTISYRPDADYHGDAQLTFIATDNIVPTPGSRIVAITVFSVADVRDDPITAIAGTARIFNTLTGANGGTPDNFAGPAVITAVTQGTHGSVGFLADGTLTYTANITHAGPDAFQYTASSGGFSEVGNVNVTVAPPNVAPLASNLSAAEAYVEDTPRDLDDIVITDPDSSVVSATLTLSDPGAGSLTTATAGSTTSTYVSATGTWSAGGAVAEVNALLAGVQFSPAPDTSTSLSIATEVSDGVSPPLTGSKSVTGTAVNDAPTLAPIADPAAIPPDAGQQSIPLAGISAGGGETQSISVAAASSNLSLIPDPSVLYASPASSGSLQYTPAAGQIGIATITVTLTDDGGTANGGVDTTTRQFDIVVAPLTVEIFDDGFEQP